MDFLKRIGLYLIVFLFIFSVYQDLTTGIHPNNTSNSTVKHPDTYPNPFQVIKVKVEQGDTVLSIVERIQETDSVKTNVDQIITDFKIANPRVDPYNLNTGKYYYFPIYD